MPAAEQLKYYDARGTDETFPLYAVGWAWAFDTPYKWTKQIASFFGGTRNGMAISWPARITDKGAIRSQFHDVIDVVPTILEATGIPAPIMVDGIAQKPIEGVSMVYTFDKANAQAIVDRDYQVPFTGKLNKLTISVEPPKLTPEDEKRLQEAARAAQDAK